MRGIHDLEIKKWTNKKEGDIALSEQNFLESRTNAQSSMPSVFLHFAGDILARMTRRNGAVHIAFVPKIVGRMNIIAAFSTMPLLIATISAAPVRLVEKNTPCTRG